MSALTERMDALEARQNAADERAEARHAELLGLLKGKPVTKVSEPVHEADDEETWGSFPCSVKGKKCGRKGFRTLSRAQSHATSKTLAAGGHLPRKA